MLPIRGLTVAVGEPYAFTLGITLAQNMRHLTECWVITTPEDEAVKAVARSVPGVRIFETDAFTRHGARFNKGLAVEECFSFMGRHGNILIHDADILFPDHIPLEHFRPGRLHGARRRMLNEPRWWTPDLDWKRFPLAQDGNSPIGFFQLFDASDPALAGKSYWYDVSFTHAGGGDAYFMTHWPRHLWAILPGLEVLHLGPRDTHWFGTDPEGRDIMSAFVVRNGWKRRSLRPDPKAVERVGEIVERVQVPGYPRSEFDLPFVRRAKARQ